MKLENNTVLITGGSNGIGLALAERFIHKGNQVIVCGRREEKLAAAEEALPGLHTRVCDVGDATQRAGLYQWAVEEFPHLNVLVNNAGIQRRVAFSDPQVSWDSIDNEIAINFTAPLHLTKLFLEHLEAQTDPVIINVSSGLAFIPPVMAAVYGATKAGLHSFTFCLRQQLAGVEVVEIIPPAVNTDLGGTGVHTTGVPLDEFADSVFADLAQGKAEIGYAYSLDSLDRTRRDMEQQSINLWERMKDRVQG